MGSTQQQQSLGGQEVGSRAAVIGALLLGNFALAFGPWLVRTQKKDGSWDGDGVGPIYGTAIALTILQLPFALVPIYQR